MKQTAYKSEIDEVVKRTHEIVNGIASEREHLDRMIHLLYAFITSLYAFSRAIGQEEWHASPAPPVGTLAWVTDGKGVTLAKRTYLSPMSQASRRKHYQAWVDVASGHKLRSVTHWMATWAPPLPGQPRQKS